MKSSSWVTNKLRNRLTNTQTHNFIREYTTDVALALVWLLYAECIYKMKYTDICENTKGVCH